MDENGSGRSNGYNGEDILTRMRDRSLRDLAYLINKPPRWNEQVRLVCTTLQNNLLHFMCGIHVDFLYSMLVMLPFRMVLLHLASIRSISLYPVIFSSPCLSRLPIHIHESLSSFSPLPGGCVRFEFQWTSYDGFGEKFPVGGSR